MAYVPKRFYSGQPTTGDTVLATAAGATGWIVKQIVLTNTDTVTKTITIGFPAGAALAASNHVVSALSIAAKGIVVIDMSVPLTTGETIRGLQETATAITVKIVGVEY